MGDFLLKTVKKFLKRNWLNKFNQSFDGIPKLVLQRTAQVILTIFMYVSGSMLLLFAAVPNYALTNHYYLLLEPYTFYFLNQISNIIFAFLLIGLARGIGSRIKQAFWPTAIVLIVAAFNTLFKQNFPISICVVTVIMLICLFLAKGCLYRQRLSYSWGQIIMDIIILSLCLLFYLSMGAYIYHRQIFVKFANPALMPSKQIWFSGFIGLLVAILIVVIIYRYLSHHPVHWLETSYNNPSRQKRAKNVINKYGGNEISHLAFTRDKKFYFYQVHGHDRVFFMFRKIADKLVVMGEPIGDKKEMIPAIDKFLDDANKLGLSIVFYEVSENFTMMMHERGFDFTKFGEEGFVDLNNFNLSGSKHRGDRALMHKFERNHYQFQIVKPPFSNNFLKRLKQISDNWLGSDDEKGFSLGYFSNYYLKQAPIAIMKNKKGNIISFANLMPEGNHNVISIDLMRSSKDAPSGIMDGIFISLFKKAQKNGYKVFNLGMAPLANVGESKFSFMNEKFAHLIFRYGSNFYSFQGLRRYKDKFVSVWKPRYIVYRKKGSLVFTMLQLLKIVNQKIKPKSKIKNNK